MRSFVPFRRLVVSGLAALSAACSGVPEAEAPPAPRAGPMTPVQPGGAFVPSGSPGRFLERLDVTVFQRGNVHTHSTESDGNRPPRDVYRWYRDHGYNFLGLSDHNTLTDPNDYKELETPAFVMIPAEEVTMRGARKPVHVNALCHREAIGGADFDTVGDALRWGVREVVAQGGVALVNHPNFHWALKVDDMPAARGAKLLEIWSGHPKVNTNGDARRPSHEAMWDTLLTNGWDFAGVAVDDMHKLEAKRTDRVSGPGRGWIDVFAPKADRALICDALRKGRLVASNGVRLQRVTVRETEMAVVANLPGATVEFIGVGGALLSRQAASPAGNAYKLQGGERYVRVRVTAADGTRAWTQAYRTTDPQPRLR
jgi:hypothetical protein